MADPVVGGLYPQAEGYEVSSQPGGVGTPVTSQPQTIGERLGKFNPQCGHSINSWEIIRVAEDGVTSALVCCPICRYVQNKYTPASLLDAMEIILG